MQNISQRVTAAREALGMNKSAFAKRLLYDRNYINAVEKGERIPGPKFIKQIEMLEREIASGLVSNGSPAHKSAIEEHVVSYGSDPRSALKAARDAKGWTPEQLAKVSRVPAQYIRDVEAGAVQGSSEKQLRKLAKALDLDVDALMSGSDHPPLTGSSRTFGANADVDMTAGIEARTIPLISMAQAGEMTVASFDDVYDYEGVIDYAKRGRKTFAVRIRGDSMEPIYPEGTIAIVEPEKPIQNERLVIAKLRAGAGAGGVVFKRLQFSGDVFRLISLNPRYDAIPARQQDIEWIYRVVRTQREEED